MMVFYMFTFYTFYMHYFSIISQNPKAKHKRVSKKKGCTAQIVIKEVYKFPLLKVSTMLSVYIIIVYPAPSFSLSYINPLPTYPCLSCHYLTLLPFAPATHLPLLPASHMPLLPPALSLSYDVHTLPNTFTYN